MVITHALSRSTSSTYIFHEGQWINLSGKLQDEYRKQTERLVELKNTKRIDGWISRTEGNIIYTTIFYSEISRTLQRVLFSFQKTLLGTLEDKIFSRSILESGDGEEIILFEDGSFTQCGKTTGITQDISKGKKVNLSQNELIFLRNSDIRVITDYVKQLYLCII